MSKTTLTKWQAQAIARTAQSEMMKYRKTIVQENAAAIRTVSNLLFKQFKIYSIQRYLADVPNGKISLTIGVLQHRGEMVLKKEDTEATLSAQFFNLLSSDIEYQLTYPRTTDIEDKLMMKTTISPFTMKMQDDLFTGLKQDMEKQFKECLANMKKYKK